MQEAKIEHGAEHRRPESASEAPRKQERRRHAAALGPIDDLLDEDDRGARQEAHAQTHDRGADAGDEGELSRLIATKTSAPAGISAPPTRSTGRTPNRLKKRTPTVAPTGQPITIAESAKPATSGESCITPWTNIGRNEVRPIITMPQSREAALAAAIGRRPRARARSSARASGAPGRRRAPWL